jgi:hypothetical protein
MHPMEPIMTLDTAKAILASHRRPVPGASLGHSTSELAAFERRVASLRESGFVFAGQAVVSQALNNT